MRQKVSDFLNVDLARLNLLGWLLMLTSLGTLVGGVVLVYQVTEDAPGDHRVEAPRWAIYLCIVVAALVFFGGQWLFDALGVAIYRRPRQDES